ELCGSSSAGSPLRLLWRGSPPPTHHCRSPCPRSPPRRQYPPATAPPASHLRPAPLSESPEPEDQARLPRRGSCCQSRPDCGPGLARPGRLSHRAFFRSRRVGMGTDDRGIEDEPLQVGIL